MEINLLLRLLVAHLLTDFVLQPANWVTDKRKHKAASRKLALHVLVTALFAYVFSGLYTNWLIPVVIFITHYLIDAIKAYLKENFTNFILDQLAHVVVIVLLWLTVTQQWETLKPTFSALTGNRNLWLLAAGYLFVSWPLGIIIGLATQRWRNQIAIEQEKSKLKAKKEANKNQPEQLPGTIDLLETSIDIQEVMKEEQGLGLASAGKWIGICERMLILTFVLLQQYTAISFLMTAKSILRFSEKEANTQLKTEYVLVGTLVSFTSAALTGVLLRYQLIPV